MTEAIDDILDRRDTSNLNKYIQKYKDSETFVKILAISASIFSLLVIAIVVTVLNSFSAKSNIPQQHVNVAIENKNLSLHLLGKISGSEEPLAGNLMQNSGNYFFFTITPKKLKSFHFRIGESKKKKNYMFGGSPAAYKVPIGKAVPAFNGPGIRNFVFVPDELTSYLVVFEIQKPDTFNLKISKKEK